MKRSIIENHTITLNLEIAPGFEFKSERQYESYSTLDDAKEAHARFSDAEAGPIEWHLYAGVEERYTVAEASFFEDILQIAADIFGQYVADCLREEALT